MFDRQQDLGLHCILLVRGRSLLDLLVAEVVGDDLDLLEPLDAAESVLGAGEAGLLAESPAAVARHAELLFREGTEVLNGPTPTVAENERLRDFK